MENGQSGITGRNAVCLVAWELRKGNESVPIRLRPLVVRIALVSTLIMKSAKRDIVPVKYTSFILRNS